MTPEEHNKYVGIGHLAYAGIQTLLFLGIALVLLGVFAVIPTPPEGSGELFAVGAIFTIFMGIFWLLFALPSFIAGYGMLKRKPWARVAGIVASVLAAMNVPHGTAICIYSLWFLFSEQGNSFYKQTTQQPGFTPQGSYLPNAPYAPDASWNTADNRQREYVPPSNTQPPDWRS